MAISVCSCRYHPDGCSVLIIPNDKYEYPKGTGIGDCDRPVHYIGERKSVEEVHKENCEDLIRLGLVEARKKDLDCGECRFFDSINEVTGRCALKKSPNGGYPRNADSESCVEFKDKGERRICHEPVYPVSHDAKKHR